MIEAVDLLDLEAEREVFENYGPGDEIEDEEDEVALPMLEGENNVINLIEVGEVDEQEPMSGGHNSFSVIPHSICDLQYCTIVFAYAAVAG